MKLKAKDIRQMGEEQLKEKMAEVKKELMKANSQIAVGTIPESPGRIKQIKKTIARILTILSEKKRAPKEKSPKAVQEEAKKK